MSLSRLRREIDRIDAELLRLLNRRAKLALRVGRLKRKQRQPVFAPRRERMVLRRMVRVGRGPLPAASIRAIFQEILRQSRNLQVTTQKKKVGDKLQASSHRPQASYL